MTASNQQDQVKFPVPPGRLCNWYYKGALDLEPRLAMVMHSTSNGELNLTIHEENRQNHILVRGVRHKDDPFHGTHPVHKTEAGVWDYLPGLDPRKIATRLTAAEAGMEELTKVLQQEQAASRPPGPDAGAAYRRTVAKEQANAQ
jgi:hypothetical protein